MTFDTMGKVDLSRDGDNAPLFAMGCPTVMEFTRTQDGLQLAGGSGACAWTARHRRLS